MIRSMRQGESYVDLASSFKITTDSESDSLAAAIQRYTAIIFADGKPGTSNSTDAAASTLASLHVTVTDPSEDLGLETCENYTIRYGRPDALPHACFLLLPPCARVRLTRRTDTVAQRQG